ncbi:site-specific tyrosine recombinase XerC [uncultured Microbulbifer sp.]|uniref:site-specific tyrosine recombinase XerC n=2 Tax=Microbulbifer TaxID=48073 RepID=UPI00261E4D71|nr:site-specific tyrosine recombinase XerC [uncultured Microbulbifer sp.]
MAYNKHWRRGLYKKNQHRAKAKAPKPRQTPDISHNGLTPYLLRFIEWSAVRGLSEQTCRTRDRGLQRFIAWCDERDLNDPRAITRPILENYQKHLYYYRKSNGEPLSYGSQHALLAPLRAFFKWLARENYIALNPASELELPKQQRGLPKQILSVEEVESLFATVDTQNLYGVRDRAMLELLYSTGIRRMELVNLGLYDTDTSRKTLLVRQGKGRKDRLLPVGERALHWVERYRREVRHQLLTGRDEGHLFLTDYGEPWINNRLTEMVKKYLYHAGIDKPGACHLLRHAMATHMLENGADIRFIQQMLGHSDLSTTQIYTQVSIEKLREIHAATHPAKLKDKAAATWSGRPRPY